MKTVTIPFDLEIAKKIQNGEVEGRIVNKALKSFMNKVCEEQRKICANDAKLYYNFYFSSFPTPEKIEKVVKNSTTPNLSDL